MDARIFWFLGRIRIVGEPFEISKGPVKKISTPVIIEIRPGGAWSYSINGITEASGTIAGGFDLTKSYHVAVYGQDDNGGGKSIQHLALERLEAPGRRMGI
ncbi:hypothetical protein ACFL6U_15410 [Planctomycetota bacterium]